METAKLFMTKDEDLYDKTTKMFSMMKYLTHLSGYIENHVR